MIIISKRPAEHRLGVLYIATYNGIEFTSGADGKRFKAWMQDIAQHGRTMALHPRVTIPAGTRVIDTTDRKGV